MAIRTTVCLVVPGTGLQLIVMRSGLRQGLTIRWWGPTLVGVLITVSTLTMRQALVERDRRNVERLIQRQATGMAHMLSRLIHERATLMQGEDSDVGFDAQRLLTTVDQEEAGAYACALHDGDTLLARCTTAVDARTRL